MMCIVCQFLIIYCPGFNKLIDVACSELIGNIRYVDACFTKLENEGRRELRDKKYGGSFTELGSYCLLPIIKLFGAKKKSGLRLFMEKRYGRIYKSFLPI